MGSRNSFVNQIFSKKDYLKSPLPPQKKTTSLLFSNPGYFDGCYKQKQKGPGTTLRSRINERGPNKRGLEH